MEDVWHWPDDSRRGGHSRAAAGGGPPVWPLWHAASRIRGSIVQIGAYRIVASPLVLDGAIAQADPAMESPARHLRRLPQEICGVSTGALRRVSSRHPSAP